MGKCLPFEYTIILASARYILQTCIRTCRRNICLNSRSACQTLSRTLCTAIIGSTCSVLCSQIRNRDGSSRNSECNTIQCASNRCIVQHVLQMMTGRCTDIINRAGLTFFFFTNVFTTRPTDVLIHHRITTTTALNRRKRVQHTISMHTSVRRTI